jgi:hypothetical protein
MDGPPGIETPRDRHYNCEPRKHGIHGTYPKGKTHRIEESLVVEIKVVDKLLPIHSSQLMTYMRLQKVYCGLLLNFNVTILPQGIRRILL